MTAFVLETTHVALWEQEHVINYLFSYNFTWSHTRGRKLALEEREQRFNYKKYRSLWYFSI